MDTEACYGIIPARYHSSRFPGKPLAPILGKPMFWHVFSRARRCADLKRVVLATDDERILEAARAFEVPAVLTGKHHNSGTDRVMEAAELLGIEQSAVVVNIQGDEPLLRPEMLSALIRPLRRQHAQVATLACTIDAEAAADADQVKVVCSADGRALYFSRAPVPYHREAAPPVYYGHIGLYAFRLDALRTFVNLPPGRLEQIEKLEQLRLLENKIPIQVVLTPFGSVGVDRPADLARVEALLCGGAYPPID
jgi:3-deoxy-manno-octulosonate cytidylyltransferase (CMP-KDO synthetase)